MPEAPRMVPPLERLLHLKRIPLLSGLPASEVAVLADAAQERSFPKGAVVFREGTMAGSMLFVVDGALANFRRGIQVGTLRPGHGIGGLSVLAREPLGSLVVAEADTLALEIDADAIAEVLEDRFPIVQYLLRELNRQTLELLLRHRLDPSAFFAEPPREPPGQAGFDLVDRLLLLRRMPVFERSSVTALAELARTMAHVRFEAETVLWQEGEPSPGILLVCGGSVRATGSGGIDFRAGPGFPLGALEALGQRPRWYEAVAQSAVDALHGPIDVVVDLLEDNFEMAMDYLAIPARATLRILDWSAAQGEQPLEG